MSKDLIKEFLSKFSEAESCDVSKSASCDVVGGINNHLDKTDLRFNKNKINVLKNLDNLANLDDCNICSATDGLFKDLTDKWKRNKLKY